jgi:hypothetical protein
MWNVIPKANRKANSYLFHKPYFVTNQDGFASNEKVNYSPFHWRTFCLTENEESS